MPSFTGVDGPLLDELIEYVVCVLQHEMGETVWVKKRVMNLVWRGMEELFLVKLEF